MVNAFNVIGQLLSVGVGEAGFYDVGVYRQLGSQYDSRADAVRNPRHPGEDQRVDLMVLRLKLVGQIGLGLIGFDVMSAAQVRASKLQREAKPTVFK